MKRDAVDKPTTSDTSEPDDGVATITKRETCIHKHSVYLVTVIKCLWPSHLYIESAIIIFIISRYSVALKGNKYVKLSSIKFYYIL